MASSSWCQARPTVVVISACYSGIFVDGLAAPNRMIMTAARRDRSSFGCSEDATYPYFDAVTGKVKFDAMLEHTYEILEDAELTIVHLTKQHRF